MPWSRIVLLAVILSTSAHGRARAEADAPGPRSPRVAFALPIGTVIAGGALLIATSELELDGGAEIAALASASALLVVGPSAGHLYAGEPSHAALMSVVRGGGELVFAVGLLRVLDACRERSCADDRGGPWLIGGGLVIWSAGAVIDMLDAPRAARRANRRTAMQLVPAMVGTAAAPAPGLAVAGQF